MVRRIQRRTCARDFDLVRPFSSLCLAITISSLRYTIILRSLLSKIARLALLFHTREKRWLRSVDLVEYIDAVSAETG
jgi:hypothetical protein